jgi:ParB/RepB/Spo0J family partition protein
MTNQIVELPVDTLTLGHDFRIDDDPEALAELVESIRQLGIIQPLLVRKVDGRHEVIAGRRRLSAARHAGLTVVPCIERFLTDDEAIDVTIAENLHRRHLSPIEEGLAFARMRDQGLTQAQIAARVGRSDFHVSVLLQILELPGETRDRIHTGQLAYSKAYDELKRKRGSGTKSRNHDGRKPEDESEIISHWRQRHDRLIAGIRAVIAARDGSDRRILLERLLRLDLEPLKPIESKPDWRQRTKPSRRTAS